MLIYAVAENDPPSARVEELLASGGVQSVQILNEFVSVARRKILLSWSAVTQALGAFQVPALLRSITIEIGRGRGTLASALEPPVGLSTSARFGRSKVSRAKYSNLKLCRPGSTRWTIHISRKIR